MTMKSASCIFLALTIAAGAAPTFADTKPETPHLVFVTEYIRELAQIENIRVTGERELKQDPKATFSSAIHTSTLFQLELGSQIGMLKGMRLNAPFDDLIPEITTFYERKIDLWQRTLEISSDFVAGPKPGIDYGKLAAEMPQIRAKLDYILVYHFIVMEF